MAIPVELLFVFVLSHLLPAFLDDASHDLPSFPFMQNSIYNHIRLSSDHTGEPLNFGHDEIPKDVDIRSLDQNDDIVRTRRRVGSLHSLYS